MDSADPSFPSAPHTAGVAAAVAANATESEPLRHPGGAAPRICNGWIFLISILTPRKNS